MRCAEAFRVALLLASALAAAACAGPNYKPGVPERPIGSRGPRPARGEVAPPVTTPSVVPPKVTQPSVKLSPEERFAGAMSLMKANQFGDAEQALKVLTIQYPQYSGPWTNLGIIYAKTNRKKDAREAFGRAVNANPQNAAAFDWLGIMARDDGSYAQAESFYHRAIAADPRDARAHYNLGILYDKYLRRPDDALGEYRRYRDLAGKDDLRVSAWIASLEAAGHHAPADTTPAGPATPHEGRP